MPPNIHLPLLQQSWLKMCPPPHLEVEMCKRVIDTRGGLGLMTSGGGKAANQEGGDVGESEAF